MLCTLTVVPELIPVIIISCCTPGLVMIVLDTWISFLTFVPKWENTAFASLSCIASWKTMNHVNIVHILDRCTIYSSYRVKLRMLSYQPICSKETIHICTNKPKQDNIGRNKLTRTVYLRYICSTWLWSVKAGKTEREGSVWRLPSYQLHVNSLNDMASAVIKFWFTCSLYMCLDTSNKVATLSL